MRLIDAEQIGLTDVEIIMCDGDYKEALEMLIDKIANAPTIEPQRMKATLINPNPYGPCSECGYLIDIRDGFNYCPNCGADMREVQE